MIELRDVTLTYPDGDGVITAVNAANLTVRPGEITAITGASGSGKSSVLAVASTLISPQQGSVLINGTATAGLSRSETAALRRDQIGIVFQQANLLASLTALEQLELMSHLGSAATKRSKAETRAKALGASTSSLVRDALGQAFVVLLVGVGLGIGLTIAAGAALPAAVPFVISPLTTLVPGIAMVGLGLVGAAFARSSVVKADPLSALNAQNS